MTHTIRKTFTLPLPPSRAFALLTDARMIRRWSGQRGRVQPRIGGTFSMFDGWVTGVVLAYASGRSLAYTWKPDDWPPSAEPSIVVYRFVRAGRNTRVTLVHKNLANASTAKDHAAGWTKHVIEPLKDFLNKKGA